MEIDVEALINESSMSRFQWIIIALGFIVIAIDGFDTQAIAFVAPEIVRLWGVAPAAFGPIFSIGLFGGIIGGLLVAPLGDRYSHRRVLIAVIFSFAICTLLTAWATSMTQLLLLRLGSGIGLGSAIPIVVAVVSDYSSRRNRATVVTAATCCIPLGAVLGGTVSARLIATHGWQSTFYLGGLLPLLLLPLLLWGLPETVPYMVARRRAPAAIARALARIGIQIPDAQHAVFVAPPVTTRGPTFKYLFQNGHAWGSIWLGAASFMSALLGYLLINWLPTVLRGNGFSIQTAVMASVTLNASGLVAGLCYGRLIDKFGPYVVMVPVFLIGAVFVAAIALAQYSAATALGAIFLVGISSFACALIMGVPAALYYPAALRATGLGWTFALGRVGAVTGPLLAGALLSAGFSTRSLFFLGAAASLLAALMLFNMRSHINRGVRAAPADMGAARTAEG